VAGGCAAAIGGSEIFWNGQWGEDWQAAWGYSLLSFLPSQKRLANLAMQWDVYPQLILIGT